MGRGQPQLQMPASGSAGQTPALQGVRLYQVSFTSRRCIFFTTIADRWASVRNYFFYKNTVLQGVLMYRVIFTSPRYFAYFSPVFVNRSILTVISFQSVLVLKWPTTSLSPVQCFTRDVRIRIQTLSAVFAIRCANSCRVIHLLNPLFVERERLVVLLKTSWIRYSPDVMDFKGLAKIPDISGVRYIEERLIGKLP